MSTRARLQNQNDSKSLWNYTLSPGWSGFDAHILRMAVMKYGCGAWRDIGKHFPLKNCNQLNLQTQRLFGQQALAEFNKVHIDPNRVKVVNDKIDGFRKNQCLINTGNNVSAEERGKRREKHIKTYGIPKDIYEKMEIPVVLDPPALGNSVIDDIEKLREMYRCIYDIELRVKHLQKNNGKNAANIKLNAEKKKKKENSDNKNKANKNKANNNNSNSNSNNSNNNNDNDIEMEDKNDENKDMEIVENQKEKEVAMDVAMDVPMDVSMGGMDEDTQMAMVLSMSMAAANIKTPKPKTKNKKKKSSRKKSKNGSKKKKKPSTKKKGKKRKKMDDEPYIPKPSTKRVKTK